MPKRSKLEFKKRKLKDPFVINAEFEFLLNQKMRGLANQPRFVNIIYLAVMVIR